MTVERSGPFIWVTWITKLMAGENQCQWGSWFRSHYEKWQKVPSDFDSAKWTAEHNQLVEERMKKLEAEGFTVYIEDQNSFKLPGKETDVTLSGKPDIVAIKGKNGYVEDCKTGNSKYSDHMQVMIYMITLPFAVEHCKSISLDGRIIYKDSIVEIPLKEVEQKLRDLFRKTVLVVGGSEKPRKVPSWGECRFCDISKTDCPERVESEPTPEEHDLF